MDAKSRIFLLLLSLLLLAGSGSASLLIPDQGVTGKNLSISGTTKFNTDNTILVEVFPASFGPESKYNSSMTGGGSVTVPVTKGDSDLYQWNASFQTAGWKPDEYIILVEVIGKNSRESARMNITSGEKDTIVKNSSDPAQKTMIV